MSEDSLLETLTALVAVATLPLGILAGIFVNGEAAAVVFVVGWFLLVPVLGILEDKVDLEARIESARGSARESANAADAGDDAALQRLRERYASGELDEAEFERRLERLLETEDVDLPPGASLSADSPRAERDDGRDADHAPRRAGDHSSDRDADREPEPELE